MTTTNKLDLNVMADILRKGTLDLAIQMIQMKFKEKRMKVKMISGPRNIITVLDVENKMIDFSEHDEVTINFGDWGRPLRTIENIQKYVGVNSVDVEIYDSEENPRVVFLCQYNRDGTMYNQRHRCIMCDGSVIEQYILGNDYDDLPRFAEYMLSQDMLRLFYQAAALAGPFGKIYFRLTDGILSIDATDENNIFEDKHRHDFAHDVSGDNMLMAFDFENFTHLLNLVKAEMTKDNAKEFSIGFTWYPEDDSGVIRVFNEIGEPGTEKYEKEEYMLLNRPL